jgi:tetratricopeptide (TPR) repeat protein
VNARSMTQRLATVGFGGGMVAVFIGGTVGAAIGIPAVLLACGGLITSARRQARQFNHENLIAFDALHSGELGKAHEILDYWSDLHSNRQIRVLSRHNLATVWMQQSKLEEARKLHQDNSEYELKSLRRMGLPQLSAACVAYAHALLGELDAATKWLAIAKTRSQPPQVPNAEPTRLLVEAIVELRRGHPDVAAKLLDDNWPMIEGRVVALSLRPYRLLRAFARSAAGPREVGRAHDDVDSVRPRYPSEHAFLGAQWPEMAAFLATNGLV